MQIKKRLRYVVQLLFIQVFMRTFQLQVCSFTGKLESVNANFPVVEAYMCISAVREHAFKRWKTLPKIDFTVSIDV